jgi:hypothetical protein
MLSQILNLTSIGGRDANQGESTVAENHDVGRTNGRGLKESCGGWSGSTARSRKN